MILRGQVWKFGNDVNTDVIIPLRYCNLTDPYELGRHCMEGIDPDFPKKVKPGDIMVATKNFGCGSSREPAPIAIKGIGISCLIAKTFARIFYRNAFNCLSCSSFSWFFTYSRISASSKPIVLTQYPGAQKCMLVN